MNLGQSFTKNSLKTYQKWLISQKLPAATIKRKLSSLNKFKTFYDTNYLKKEANKIGKGSVLKGSWISKRTDPIGKRLLSYLYLSLLVLFSVALASTAISKSSKTWSSSTLIRKPPPRPPRTATCLSRRD